MVADSLRARIRQGEWPVSALLPNETDLCGAYGVSRSTVREAMRTLQAEGLLARRRGAGTVVTAPAGAARAFVGLVVAHLDDARLAATMQGLHTGLAADGLRLELRATADEPAAEAEAVRGLRSEGAAGIILEPLPGTPSRELLRGCRSEGFPLVFLDRYDSELDVPYAVADNRQGAADLARHLLACGHRRIAMLLPRSYPLTSVLDRVAGYRQALAEAGIEPDPGLMVRPAGALPDPLDDALRAAVNGLMARPQPPTAILCANDEIASWTMALLKETGVRVPADCSLAGFDDMDYAARLDPPLTTVRQPLHAIGEAAAACLRAQLEGRRTAPAVLPTRLVVRQSTGRIQPRAVLERDG